MGISILRGFISIFGSKAATLLIGLLTTPILVRLLGSSQYGDYAFLLSMLGISMILINAGIFDGTRKYMAEDRDNSNWTENVLGFYFRLACVLAVTGALVYAIFSWSNLSRRFFGNDFTIYFYFLGILIIVRQTNSVARGGLMGLGLEERSEPLNILKKVLFSILALYLAYIGYGVVGVLAGHIISTSVVSVLAWAILSQYVDFRSIFTKIPERFPKRKLLSFNSLSIVLIFLTGSLYHVDILFLRLLVGDQATGYYKAALVVAEFLWFVPNVLQTVLLHSSSQLWSDNRLDRIASLASQTTRYNLTLVLLLTIGLASLAHDFIPIYYGPEFDAAVLPLLLLLPGVFGFALARPIFAIGQGKGQLQILIVATGAASLLNVFLNAVLIPRYGMVGAAVATSMGYGSMLVLHVLAARRIGFNPLDDLRLKNLIVVAVVSAGVIFGLSSVIRSSIVSLVIVPPIGFIVYSTMSLRFSVVSPEEVRQITWRLPTPVKDWINEIVRYVS
jgi:O-antigen/teichoic acid export membrane protein